MAAPSKVRLHLHIEGQGDYPTDPRMRVGAGRHYTSKEAIPSDVRYPNMWTFDDDGKLWILKGGVTDGDWLDIFATFVLLSQGNQANGYAALDVNGKLANSVIPALAIGNTFVEGSQAAMLALNTAEIGDICKRTDTGETFILQSADYTQLASWVDISSNFSGGVETVNGKAGTNITLNQDEVPDGPTYKRVTQAEKNTWNGKQNALAFDEVPTFESDAVMTSGAIFDYLKTIQSSVNNKSWTGDQADGNNRFNLDVADEDIDQMIWFMEGGVPQHEDVHYTIDVAKRYIEFTEAPDPTKTYYLKYLSNIPVVSLTSVAMVNVEGLLDAETQKIKEENLPEGVGGYAETDFAEALKFDKDYSMSANVTGAIAFTLDNTGAKRSKKTIIYLKANGVNKPTFSADFVIYSDNWDNQLNMWNRIFLEYLPSGKVLVDITYTHAA